MIALAPSPSAAARMILARQTCFWGLLRAAATASKRARSAAETSTVIPPCIRPRWGRLGQKGTNRLGHSTLMSRFKVRRHERSSPDRFGSTHRSTIAHGRGRQLKTTVEHL